MKSWAHQSCIYLIKYTVKSIVKILLQFKITVFCFNIMYSCDGKKLNLTIPRILNGSVYIYLLVCIFVQRDIPRCLAESLTHAGPSLCPVCAALPDTPRQIRGAQSSGTAAKYRYKTQLGTFEFTQTCRNVKFCSTFVGDPSLVDSPSSSVQRNITLFRGFCAMKYALYAICVNAHMHTGCLDCEPQQQTEAGQGVEPPEGDSAADLDNKPVKNFLSEFNMILSFKCHKRANI